MTAAGDWVAAAAARLSEAGIARARAEARSLLAAAMGTDAAALFAYPERPIAPDALASADDFLARRAAGEPLGRVLGVREFWSLPFRLAPDVLEPRPDTETLVAAALELKPDRKALRILDLGVGSGCILLALLSELPDATGLGVDRSPGAAAAAAGNAAALGLADRARFAVGDWGQALADGAFDLVVSNPPYIARAEGPAPDAATVAFDPPAALWAGADGLDAYRALLPDAPRLTAPGGLVLLEIGAGQADAVAALAAAAGLTLLASRRDIAGHVRCLAFRRGVPPHDRRTSLT